MSLQISQLLLSAQSADAQARTSAVETLKQLQDKSFSQFLLSLSMELSDDQKPLECRRLAGIILKNALDDKDASRKEELHQQWVNLDPSSIKAQIKELLLQTLGSSLPEASHTASQAIAKVASIEIPRSQWPDLIERLLINMMTTHSPPSLRQATLQTLGYFCEEVSPQDLEQKQVNAVLTAVVNGMTEGSSDKVRLAAVRALYNALGFAQTNFENEMERNFIMKVLCETAVSKELEIRQAAFECLVSVASMYYEFLEPFMEALFVLTSNAVKGDEEAVALQAVEFWSSICDEEIQIQEGSDDGRSSSDGYRRFIRRALHPLVTMLLETMLKQQDDEDEDEDDVWNLSMAGGTCLGLVAKTVGDEILGLVLPFVESNITKPDWRCREAATFAFGSIVEGPSVEKLSPIVHAGLDFLLNAMKDQNRRVKETTAWTLGRIMEVLHCSDGANPIVTTANLQRIVSVLLDGIQDAAPHVADKVCGAIYFLAQGYEEDDDADSVLTPYLGDLIFALLLTADRGDAASFSKLRSSAYETVNELVRCCQVPETSNMVAQLLNEIMIRLGRSLEVEKQSDLQGLLCGALQVIVQKLCSSEDTKLIVLQAADQIMALLLGVLACRSSTVHEEAMLAIGALAYATGEAFLEYMPGLYKYLEMGLQNHAEYQVCSTSVGVVGDICRALDDKVLPYCDGFMSILLKNQADATLHRSVKPPIFSCFGDVALAIGEGFERYATYVMSVVQEASRHCANLDDMEEEEEMVEYGNELRRGIFEAYSGILQGSKGGGSKAELMLLPYAKHLLQFTEAVVKDAANRDDAVTKSAVAVIGDLADALGPKMKVLFKEEAYFPLDFLDECFSSEDVQLNETATWTRGMLGRVLAS